MIPVGALAQLCADIYETGRPFLTLWSKDAVVVGLAQVGDVNVLVLRGSITVEDWARDAAALPVTHPQLGRVHAGFVAGMDDVYQEVCHLAGSRLVITGHSLGGARARILAALFAVRGIPVEQLTTFGSPKPGFIQLAQIIQNSGVAHTSYRNRRDAVPTLPLTLSPLFSFVHPEDWTTLDVAPVGSEPEVFADHSIALYVKALTS